MKPISLQLYTLREAAAGNFIGVLKEVAEIGYKGVEPAGLHGHRPEEIRSVLDDLGVVCSSAHGPLPTKENLQEIVDTAGTLGCEMVVTGAGRDEFAALDAVKGVADRFNEAVELIRPHGLRLGYHNHWWEMNEVDARLGLEALLELAPEVFSQTDIYWAANFGAVDVPAFVAKHAARIPCLHVKDGPLVEGRPHTAVGKGKMPTAECIAAADPDVLEWLIVELDECATDMMEAVAESYTYLTGEGLAEGNA